MNDFTKKELQLLHEGLSYAARCSVKTGGVVADILFPIAKKIQSMIDNYCNHEWMCWDDVHNTRECMKCGLEIRGEII